MIRAGEECGDREPSESEARDYAREQQLLLEVSQRVSGTLDLETVLQTISDGAAQLMQVETAAIYLRDGDNLYLGATTPPLNPKVPEHSRQAKLPDHPHIAEAVATCLPVSLLDARSASLTPEERWIVEARDLRSLLYLPFQHEGSAIGVLILGTKTQVHEFSSHERKLCETITNELALGIQNARLHTQLRQHATELELQAAERARAEDRLRRSERRYRSLFEQAGDYILVLEVRSGGTLVIADANEAACQKHGYKRDELVGMPIMALDRGMDIEQTPLLLEKVFSGERVLFETAHARKDGQVFPVEVSAALLDIGEGPPSLISIERDITERRRAEEALRRSEERHRALFELSRDAIMTIAPPHWHYTSANPATIAMFGAEGESRLTTMTPWDLAPDCQPDGTPSKSSALDRIEAAIRGDISAFSWTHKRINGEEFPASVLLSRIEWSGNPMLLATVRDITKEVELENRSRQAQKMEAVGQLAGGVAHDFNNLLQVISGYGSIIEDQLPDDPAVREGFSEMLHAAERATGLVRQMLAFSRRQQLELVHLDVNMVVADALKLLSRVIGEHIQLDFLPEHPLGAVLADRGQIEQILMNLCVNARDAMPDGGAVTIKTQNVVLDAAFCQALAGTTPGKHVLLTVSDTGCGMDQDTAAHAFEPFYTTKGLGQGTGLGLATVYGIVKQHGGYIKIDTELDAGTQFSIYLPVTESARFNEAPDQSPEVQGGTETILLVEDSKPVRQLATAVLSRAGYTVIAAADGHEAYRRYRDHENEIDLLFTDIMLPGQSGRTVCERIQDRNPGLPVVFTSGYEPASMDSGVTANGQHFIQKPYSPSTLLRAIREALNTAK